jgi:hypothetical protein
MSVLNATFQQWKHPLDFPLMEQNFSFAKNFFQTSLIIFGMLLNGTAVLFVVFSRQLSEESRANEIFNFRRDSVGHLTKILQRFHFVHSGQLQKLLVIGVLTGGVLQRTSVQELQEKCHSIDIEYLAKVSDRFHCVTADLVQHDIQNRTASG